MCAALLIGRDVLPQLREAALADAAHGEQMFEAAEPAVPLAVLDDAARERGADAGQSVKFFDARAVDVDERGRRRALRAQRVAGQFGVERTGRSALQPDA